ncbi:MAG: adenylate/guanylate cyclase domain-containing protein [Bacteroidales bacterium]
MNLFLKSYKFYLFFFLVVFLKSPLLLGHNTDKGYNFIPAIKRFDIPAIYNRSPNTTFIRTSEGVVFIGKHNGMLTVDQDQVYFTATEEPVFLSYTYNDKVVYLTANDFGFIEYDHRTGPVMRSEIKKVKANFLDFYPSEIASGRSNTFLSTSEGVFVLNDNSAKLFFFNRLLCDLHHSGEQIYLEVEKMGLYQWGGDEFRMLVADSDLKKGKIASIVDWQEGALLFMENGECYYYDPENQSLKGPPHFVSTIGDYQLLQRITGNQYLAVNEADEPGIISTDDFDLIPLSISGYLPSLRPASLFADSFNDLWMVYDFDVYKIECPSRSYTLDLTGLIKGTILSSAILDETIYLGTDDGLFLLHNRSEGGPGHRKISGDDGGYFHLLDSHEGLVIAGGNSGLYEIVDHSVRKISADNFFFIEVIDRSSFIGCAETGFFHYRKKEGQWKPESIGSAINHINSAVEIDNRIWFQAGNHSIFYYEPAGKGEIDVPGNLPADSIIRLVANKGDLLLLGKQWIWKWNPETGSFSKEQPTALTRHLLTADLIVNKRDQLWSVKNTPYGRSTLWMLDNGYDQYPFFEIMGDRSFGRVKNIMGQDGRIWIAGSQKIILLDTAVHQHLPDRLLRIRSVEWRPFADDPNSRVIVPEQKVGFSKGQIRFDLADTRYQSEPSPYYRYKLTHYQDEWSDWSRNRSVVFENLWERKYKFQAQSVSSFGQLSVPVTFSFRVVPPIYRTWYAYLVYLFAMLVATFLLYKWRLLSLQRVEFALEEKIKERMVTVLSEKEKSDKLVADLFPKGTAEELKSKGRAQSKKFEMATVLFSDIQGFTKIAEEMNPEVLIDELDKFFFHFDSVVEKYNIEKIKTIGDAYMAAGGIPVKNSSNPVEVVLAGIEMQYYMKDLKRKKADIWDLRIGIHTGPVITGVVGHKKLSYDIWGDTVNTASRMESSGEGGKVNISGITYGHVKDFFLCEYRGKLPVKYKGNIDMYFVTGLRPELSVDLHGIPNKRFFTKLQMLKLNDLEERVSELIFANHQLSLHFHRKEFFSRVYQQTELLGRSENISDDDRLLALAAATVLFAGLSETYDNFENRSAEIARDILPEFGFDARQTERVSNLIVATKEPFLPRNNLEAIIIDARMEFIGRVDYLTQVKLLYLEVKNMTKDFSKDRFIRKQKALIKEFKFFTFAARRLREISAEEQIENLESWK